VNTSGDLAEATYATFLVRQTFIAFSRLDAVQEAVVSALAIADDGSIDREFDPAVLELVEEFKATALSIVDELGEQVELEPEPSDLGSALRVVSGPMDQMESRIRRVLEDASPRLIASITDDPTFGFDRAIEFAFAEPLSPLGLNALLTSTVACFERSVGNCIFVDVALHDTLSPEDAARRVTKTLFQRGWLPYFEQRSVASRALTPNWDDIEELLARRNAIVHNGGRADARYREASGHIGIEDHAPLHIDVDYLVRATDLLAALAMLIAASMHPSSSTGAALISEYALYLMHKNQPRRAEFLLIGGQELSNGAESSAITEWTVNLALARKMQFGRPHIADEVEAWVIPDAQPVFGLARDLLLDRPVGVERVNALIGTGDLTLMDVQTWPIFKVLRDTSEEIQAFLRSAQAAC